MAKISIPLSDNAYYTDQMLYLSVRRKGTKSKFSEWSVNTPLVMNTPSFIDTPSLDKQGESLLQYASAGDETTSLTFQIFKFKSLNGASCASAEYEIYKNFTENNNLIYTGVVSSADDLIRFVTIPTEVYVSRIKSLNEIYIRARFIDSNGDKSPWSRFVHINLQYVKCGAPKILNEVGSVLNSNTELLVSLPTITNQYDTDITDRYGTDFTDSAYVRIEATLYDITGNRVNSAILRSGTIENRVYRGLIDSEFFKKDMVAANNFPVSMTVRCVVSGFHSPESEGMRLDLDTGILSEIPDLTPTITTYDGAHGIYPRRIDRLFVNYNDWVPSMDGDDLEYTEYQISSDPEFTNIVESGTTNQ